MMDFRRSAPARDRNLGTFRTRVKICGITRVEDALLACELGADAIGLVMTPSSPRCVSIDRAREIRAALPAFVSAVVLTHDLPAERVRAVIDGVHPDLVQFHGREDAAFCESFGLRYVKALGMAGDVDVHLLVSGHPRAAGFVLDGHPPGQQGGRGRVFDWSRIPRDLGRPVILAGGINADNIVDAIRSVRPWAVDLASGVESSPGIKDAGKLRAFFAAVRAAEPLSQWERGRGEGSRTVRAPAGMDPHPASSHPLPEGEGKH